MFEISTLDFIKNKFLINTVNFGIGLDFSKIPGSAFNDDPGLGQLYKVCPYKTAIMLFLFSSTGINKVKKI